MSPDLELAHGLLRDAPKAQRQFARRFRETLDRSLEHAGEALQLGLMRDRYVEGVALAAARSLLASLPLTATEASLDPFVRRICSRREFGLTLLLLDDRDAAWDAVQRRYRAFSGSLLLRRGVPGDRVDAEREALFAELRAPDPEGCRPIETYRGRSDFRDWLFVYVRTRFRGAAPLVGLGEGPRPLEIAEGQRAIATTWPTVFAALRDAMSDADRELLERAAFGRPLEEETVTRDLNRHRELLDRTFSRVVEVLAARLGRKADAIDEDLRGLLVDEVEGHLRLICGAVPE